MSDSDSESELQPKKVDKKKKVQKREASSSGDEGVSDPTPLKKKTKTEDGTTTIKNAEGVEMVEIGKMKYACVRSFKGQTYIDIREYYMDKDGQMKPGKKGISLSTEQYANFKKTIGYIDGKLANA
ncbi:hypothetical protein PMAYCL1PPCAC_15291 [Pristionchus mayeri]|uniref:Transcriptional coactivator p15 (PC4) C-terminal domain-containing protein n=1 Tax=Pristionchus mayeri TaxID=1317129 RepID=A0AAN5CIL7_9BILA|nr:hypothetical protein PMAYCL1PPCAC_15291 [Pristionchus mayeri]